MLAATLANPMPRAMAETGNNPAATFNGSNMDNPSVATPRAAVPAPYSVASLI